MDYSTIDSPTLILDAARARRNIERMAQKAHRAGIRFRPHFKTHQSAQMGEWFRASGVTAITVSSLTMAQYFASHGWKDILVAFPVNLRQIGLVNDLAERIHLELLVESAESVEFLRQNLKARAGLWIKVDCGAGRTGISWEEPQRVLELAQQVKAAGLELRGLLTHAGQTYRAPTPQDVPGIYQESLRRMYSVRDALGAAGLAVELSIGDTPGCTLAEDLGEVNEIRPGNFVLYDSQQLKIGSCTPQDVAAAVAVPVVARHAERGDVIVYGGAVHLSVDWLEDYGLRIFGYVALPTTDGWSDPIPGAFVRKFSQEHGVLHLSPEIFEKVRIGDLLMIIPAHSCLTVSALRGYRTLDGEWIETL